MATELLRKWPNTLAYLRETGLFEGTAPTTCACARLGSRIDALTWEHAMLHSLHDQVSSARSYVSQRLLNADAGCGLTVRDHWRGSGERELSDEEREVVTAYSDSMTRFDRWMDDRLTQVGDWPARVSAASDRLRRSALPTIAYGPKIEPTTHLSDDHVHALRELSAEAVRVGLSTAPANHVEADRGVRSVYRSMNGTEPRAILWASSPRTAHLVISAIGNAVVAALSSGNELAGVEMELILSTYASVLPKHLLDQISEFVRASVVVGDADDSILDSLEDWWDAPYASDAQWAERTMSDGTARRLFRLAARGVVRKVNRLVEPFVDRQIEVDDQHDHWGLDAWMPRADYRSGSAFLRALTIVGAPVSEHWQGIDLVDRHAAWWWAFQGFAVLCERPVRLERDASGRLHSEAGMAVEWPDGWGAHAWHGRWVPADLIEPGWQVQQIFAERNIELRRCAIERMGWPQFVDALGLRLVGEADDPANPGFVLSLYDRITGVFEEPVRLLLCTNASVERDGTRRRYGLTVPPDTTDPVSAAAWTFGLDASQYLQLAAAC